MSDMIVHQQEGLFTGLIAKENPLSRKNMKWDGAGTAFCVKCGEQFNKKSGAQKRCLDCAEDEKRLKAYKGTYTINCQQCGAEHVSKLSHTKFCSSKCKIKARYERNKLTGKSEDPEKMKARARNKYKNDSETRRKSIERSKKQKDSGYHKEYQEKRRAQDPNYKSIEHKKTRAKAKGMTLEQYETYCASRRQTEPKIASFKHNHSAHFFDWHNYIGMSSHVDLYVKKKNAEKAIANWNEKVSTPEGLMWSRMKTRLRQIVKRAMGNDFANSVTCSKLGYTPSILLSRLKSTLPEDATMDDFMSGALHIDHIRPCASFDLSDPNQVLECYSLNNLQLLWAKDNLRKNSKWDGQTIRKKKNKRQHQFKPIYRSTQQMTQACLF